MITSIDMIPTELRASPHWVNWRLETRDGKKTKPPINPETGDYADSTDPTTWSTFDTALRSAESRRLPGVGYVFSENSGIMGIDLDHCRNAETGEIASWAKEIIDHLNSYSEISPGEDGIHILVRAKMESGSRHVRAMPGGKIEMYERARFFTVTGNHLLGTPTTIVDRQQEFSAVYRQLFPPIGTNGNGTGHTLRLQMASDVDTRLHGALRDPVFSRLWYGDTSANNNDDSAADLALCNKLAFYFDANPSLVDSMFRQSGLMRDKWERADYRQWTIDKAIEGTRATYIPKRNDGHSTDLAKATSERMGDSRQEAADDDVPKPASLKNAVGAIIDRQLINVHYDDFLGRVMTGNPAREWTDADDLELAITLQSIRGFGRIGMETVRNAAILIAFRNQKNCVKDWLESLVWDQEPRIEHFFEDVFGAVGTTYTRAASKNFLISMVARIYQPGCQSDHMVVLEGEQGIGKSSALRIIGGDWFSEQHESATGKAFFEVLQGKWLVEISEMDSFNRAEVTKVKQIVTCTNDRFRESYGRHAKDHPRQCIFVGTTNRDDWNRDDTGARRFWPIACNGDADLAGIRAKRDQLFAEAAHRYKTGESWWEMPTEETKAEQESRYLDDPWFEMIAEHTRPMSKITVAEILIECLKFEKAKIQKGDQMRVATCLRRLGWAKGKNERVGNEQVRFWRPKQHER